MTATRNLGIPTSAYDYGTFAWHRKWIVDLPNRQASHNSGLVFIFSNAATGEESLPLGGLTPNRAWFGKLHGGASSIPSRMAAHTAMRIAKEALQIFADMARTACQDCMVDTIVTRNYYMVHDRVWRKAHPKGRGMLCLPCLQARLGRKLTSQDFTDAPLNIIHGRHQQFGPSN